jgi:hypothetical protein
MLNWVIRSYFSTKVGEGKLDCFSNGGAYLCEADD